MKLLHFPGTNDRDRTHAIRSDVIRYCEVVENGNTKVYYDEPNGAVSWFITSTPIEHVVDIVNEALAEDTT
jgi:hypothetical protein